MTPLVYSYPGNESFAAGLALHWPAEAGGLSLHHFPDGESLVRIDTPPGGRVTAIVCSLNDPDAKIWPLLQAARTLKELGAASVGLVAPYLAYLRQDARFHPGEALSAPVFAHLLSAHFDWLVTVDPHLHRVHALSEIFPIPATAVAAAPLLAQWITDHVARPLLLGPDAESRQWVTRIAEQARAPWRILEKLRSGDREVAIKVPDLEVWRDHTPVLVDDMISSGGTLIELVRQLRGIGLRPPVCVAVHAVFAPYGYWGLLEAGAGQVVTTNTIAHGSNGIDVSAAVAEASRSAAQMPSIEGRGRARSIA